MSESPAAGLSRELTEVQRTAIGELLRVFPIVDELGDRFAKAGHELHLVGGSVRDALLGRLGDDLDFATSATPDETLKALKGWAETTWETGREFGTIGAARRGLRLEITTYRAEAYDGVSRNPVVRYGTSLFDDLQRRDFTVNAMAVSLPGHAFTDPYGGLVDLAEQRLHLARADAPDLVGVAAVHGGEQPVGRLQVARMIGQRTVDHGTVRGVAVAGPGQRRDQVDGQLSVRLPYLGARLGEVLQLVGPLGRDGPGGLLVVVGQLDGRRDGPGRPCGGLG